MFDHQNTVRDLAVFDGAPEDQADVVNHLTYNSAGSVVSADNPQTGTANDGDLPGLSGTGNEYLPQRSYTGREPDAVTGLIYYRARWYDPRLGTSKWLGGQGVMALASVGLIHFSLLKSTGGNAAAASLAEANADREQGLRGAAGVLEVSETLLPGRSTGDGGGPLHPVVQEAYNSVPLPLHPPFHSKCADGRCISNALENGINPSGGVIHTRTVGGPNHGHPRLHVHPANGFSSALAL